MENELETRKIQKLGVSTLSVSLPKSWIKKTKLKQGDIVYLDQYSEDSLKIITESTKNKYEKVREYNINVDLAKENNILETLVAGAYMMGADVINVFSSDNLEVTQIEEVREIVTKLIGANILEISRNKIVIRCLLDLSKLNISPLIRQLSTTVITMLDESIESLNKYDISLAKKVIEKEKGANSIYWLITRLLRYSELSPFISSRIGIDKEISALHIKLFTTSVEIMGDCANSISNYIINFKGVQKDNDDINKTYPLFIKTKCLYKEAMEIIFSEDIIKANKIINISTELEYEINEKMINISMHLLYPILTLLILIIKNCKTIAQVSINNTISKNDSYDLKA